MRSDGASGMDRNYKLATDEIHRCVLLFLHSMRRPFLSWASRCAIVVPFPRAGRPTPGAPDARAR